MLRFVLNRFQKQIRLGDLLIQSGGLTKQQLEVALKHQKKWASASEMRLWN